jgi:hypothetical protein
MSVGRVRLALAIKSVARKKWEMKIELTEAQGKELVSYLVALSDRLTKDHQAEHSGVAQFLLLSAVQGVDRLYQEIREQVEAQTTEPEPVDNIYAVEVEG